MKAPLCLGIQVGSRDVDECTAARVVPSAVRIRWGCIVAGGCRIRTHLVLPCNEMCLGEQVHYYGSPEADVEAEVRYSHLSGAQVAAVGDHDPRLLP